VGGRTESVRRDPPAARQNSTTSSLRSAARAHVAIRWQILPPYCERLGPATARTCRVPPDATRWGVGQLLWWVNYLVKQCVPTHRPISFHARAAQPARGAGDLSLSIKKRSPPRRGRNFCPRRGSFPRRRQADQFVPSPVPTFANGPVRPGNVSEATCCEPRTAPTAIVAPLKKGALSSYYRQECRAPRASFYALVNNFENFHAAVDMDAGLSILRALPSRSSLGHGSREAKLHRLGARQVEDRRPLASLEPIDREYLGVDVCIH
jgi:hypothetical protein